MNGGPPLGAGANYAKVVYLKGKPKHKKAKAGDQKKALRMKHA